MTDPTALTSRLRILIDALERYIDKPEQRAGVTPTLNELRYWMRRYQNADGPEFHAALSWLIEAGKVHLIREDSHVAWTATYAKPRRRPLRNAGRLNI